MSMVARPAEVVMEAMPFVMKEVIRPEEVDLEMLDEIIREIIRKAVKFGIIEADRGEKLERVAKDIANEIIATIRKEVKSFCSPSLRMPRKVFVVKRTLALSIGNVNLKFVLINDGENCGIRLIEIQ